jgi:cell division protein FtsB
MSFWTAMVVMFAIAVFFVLKQQKYQSDKALGSRTADDPELEREVEQLRQRIAVLERIAIEERGRDRLAREIESLRD